MNCTFECSHLQSLRDEFSHLFGPTSTNMRSFFSQQDKVGVINFTQNEWRSKRIGSNIPPHCELDTVVNNTVIAVCSNQPQ